MPVPGGTRVSWTASTSTGPVDYRVLRVVEGGAARPVGTTAGTELEDGATGATAYVVVARRAGVLAPEARTDRPDPAPVLPATRTSAGADPVPGSAVPVAGLEVVPLGRRIRLVYPAPSAGPAEVRRLPPGRSPPAPGTRIEDPDQLGTVVPALGPGLAVDRRPAAGVTEYVVIAGGVCGAGAAYVDLPAATELRREDGRLRWTWPPGCTEVVLALRVDGPPESATDAAATVRKVTNTRYDIDGGVEVPAEGHAAVFTGLRAGGRLYVATDAPPTARLGSADTGAPTSAPHGSTRNRSEAGEHPT